MSDFAKNLQKGLAGGRKALYEDKNTQDGGDDPADNVRGSRRVSKSRSYASSDAKGGLGMTATSSSLSSPIGPHHPTHSHENHTQLPANTATPPASTPAGVGQAILGGGRGDYGLEGMHMQMLPTLTDPVKTLLNAVGVSEEDYNRQLVRDEHGNIVPPIHPDEAARILSEVADQAHGSLSRPGGDWREEVAVGLKQRMPHRRFFCVRLRSATLFEAFASWCPPYVHGPLCVCLADGREARDPSAPTSVSAEEKGHFETAVVATLKQAWEDEQPDETGSRRVNLLTIAEKVLDEMIGVVDGGHPKTIGLLSAERLLPSDVSYDGSASGVSCKWGAPGGLILWFYFVRWNPLSSSTDCSASFVSADAETTIITTALTPPPSPPPPIAHSSVQKATEEHAGAGAGRASEDIPTSISCHGMSDSELEEACKGHLSPKKESLSAICNLTTSTDESHTLSMIRIHLPDVGEHVDRIVSAGADAESRKRLEEACWKYVARFTSLGPGGWQRVKKAYQLLKEEGMLPNRTPVSQSSGPPPPTPAPRPTTTPASDDQPTKLLALPLAPPRHQQGAPDVSRGILTSKLQDEPSGSVECATAKDRSSSATPRPSVAWCSGLLEGDRGSDSDGPSSLPGSRDGAGLDKAERQLMGKMMRQRGGLAGREGEELPDDPSGVPSPAMDVTTAMRERLAVLEENNSLHSIKGQLEHSPYFSKPLDDLHLSDSHEEKAQQPCHFFPQPDRGLPQQQGKTSLPVGSLSPFLFPANLRSAIGTPGGPTRSADTKGTARGRMHNDDGSDGEDGGGADERHSRPKKGGSREATPEIPEELFLELERRQDDTLMRMDPSSQKMTAMLRAVRETCAHDQLVAEDQRKAVHLKEDRQLLSQLPTPCFPDPSFLDGLLFRHALQACVVHGAAGSLEALLRETLIKPTEKDKKRLAVGEVRAKRDRKVLKWSDLILDALDASNLYRDEPLNLVTEDYVPSPLVVQAAVANAPIQIMKTLLAYNADVNARGYAGQTKATNCKISYNTSAVGAAAMCHRPDLLRFLLREARRADPRAPPMIAFPDLLQLVCLGPPPIAAGAQPSEAQQRQALSTIEVVDAEGLIKYGGSGSGIFDINCSDSYGETPLHIAAANGWCGLVEWLLKNGADPRAVKKSNETPLDLARSHGRKECEAVLLKHLTAPPGQTTTNTAAGASTGAPSVPTAAAAGAMEEGGGVDSPAAAAHERKRQELRDRATRGVVQMKATARAIREACLHDLLTPEGRRKSVGLKEDLSLLSSLPKPMVSYMNGFVLKQSLQSCAMYGSAGSLDTLLQENFIKPTEESDDEGLSAGQVRARDGRYLKWRDLSPASIEPFEGEMIEPDHYVRMPLLILAFASDAPSAPQIVKSLVEYNADINEIGPVFVDPKTKKLMMSSAVGAASMYHWPEVLNYLLRQPHADPSVHSEEEFLAGLNIVQLACVGADEDPEGNQDTDAPRPPPEPTVGSKSRKKAASKGKRASNDGLAQEAGQQAAGGIATKETEQKEKARQSRAVATLDVLERHGLTRSPPAEGNGGRRKRPVLSLHCRDKTGWSLLHGAAGNGLSEVIKWLLERGVDAEAVNNENETPLDVARRVGEKLCVDVLMAHLEARRKAAAADLLREEEQARKKEERAARKRERKRLKRLAAEQAESAADGETEEADDTQHETEEVDQVTEEAAALSCPPDTHSDSVEPAFSDAPSDRHQQPPAGVGPSPLPPLPLSPAHGAPASHLFAAQRPSSSSSSFADPPASSTVSTTPADRPSSAQTSARQYQFCPADVTAQLRADLNGCIDKKESLEDQYSDLLAARRRAADRVKELKTNIRRLKYVTPNLSHDVLASLSTAAEVREFEAKISREEERLDELMETAVQHAMRLQSGASKPTKAPAAEQQSAAAAAAAASASTPTSAAEGCGVPVCSAMRVLLNESSTEDQLLEAIQHIQYDIDQLEGDIFRMTDVCTEAEAALQPLEQEHHTLQQEAKKRLTPTRLESLTSIAAVDAFKRDIKRAKQELREVSKEAAVRQAALEKEETAAAAAAAAADGDGGEGTCVMCISETPTVVFFPCRQKCLCEGCWRDMAAAHEAAKKEKARLEALQRRVPDNIARDAQLRCPMCNQEAHYASTVDGITTAT
ncbi:unnamed protein product [Vitrella brassicaformis CCMP3155]|uniref:Chromodomain-helicase-DNA-binding protein 1-like C-terminal domain-containing protein n=1 Tax=Vitrella brassicaformis (strain CCMP3155) TaxID=1169540 RepID=A0A0G4GV54_VITBC|nr:unnamed protein product [Vitrella brassicaformis CCMP3155]|eukprot:CEM34722.1 unnamed protein product [Vitrella brassicaformis CCMP3155]